MNNTIETYVLFRRLNGWDKAHLMLAGKKCSCEVCGGYREFIKLEKWKDEVFTK